MKKILIILSMFFISCDQKQAGTIETINGPNSNIEVSKYYIKTGEFIYITRFKDGTNVSTTTWQERQGKRVVNKTNITIYENDSIQIIRKK